MYKKIALSITILITVTCWGGTIGDTSIKGGIIVHLNCGDAKNTAEMIDSNTCLIHGLDKDGNNIIKARKYIHSKNLYGRVSVSQYDGKTLPYADNIVNLIIADSLGDVPLAEVMRVLVPGGTLLLNGESTIKPWPKEIDDWPQYLNKADNNGVAMDSVVGPPRRIQWLNNPVWGRSHMAMSTIVNVVTCNGRLFSIEDRSLPDNPFLPGHYMFVARDAFNGRTLWSHKIKQWESITTYIKCLPTQQQRRMVATDTILYCTPTLEGPLAALDAATGKILKSYDAFSPVQEVAYSEGVLFLNVGERFNAAAYKQVNKKGKGKGTKGEPFCGSGFRKGYAPEAKEKKIPSSVIMAVDPKTGKQMWKTGLLKSYTGASFAVKGNYAVYQTREGLFCINPKTGKSIWSVKKSIVNPIGWDSGTPGTMPNTVIITDDKAFSVDNKTLFAYSLKDGKVLWNVPIPLNYQASADLFYVNGSIWTGATGKPTQYDANTGKKIKSIAQKMTGPMGHDRCYRNVITEKYYINSKTGGADFLNLETNQELPNHWVRGGCGFGVLPANGLLYSTPYSCTCSMRSMFQGMNAFSSDPDLINPHSAGSLKRIIQLEKGSAYGQVEPEKKASPNDWATYRYNAFRSGITESTINAELKVKWKTKLPGKPTATTIADNKVFVCSTQNHTLYALDSKSGDIVWTFTADGRIDSPPTYYKGMLLFGSRDGWLYCLRATDGALSWRFKDLPDRLVGAFGQLESAWPISGSILVLNDKIYATAGRSSFFDSGIFLYCIEPMTGKVLNSRAAYGPFSKEGFPLSAKIRGGSKESTINTGFKNDIMVSDGTNLYLRHRAFNQDLEVVATGNKRLMPMGGFLDNRVQHRTGFIFDCEFKWWSSKPKDIMISNGQSTYYVAGFQSSHNHAYFDPRTSAYKLSGDSLKGKKEVSLPINGRALTKAGNILFVAGEPMKFDKPTWQKYVSAYKGELGGYLLAISTNGEELSKIKLDSAPAWDSISIANKQLYISLADGTVQCMGE